MHMPILLKWRNTFWDNPIKYNSFRYFKNNIQLICYIYTLKSNGNSCFMNEFLRQFETKIGKYWSDIEAFEQEEILNEVLMYANKDPHAFQIEFKEFQFEDDFFAIPVIFEALIAHSDEWDFFYMDFLNDIFEVAKISKTPNEILSCLDEFTMFSDDDYAISQKVVDRILKELNGNHYQCKIAAIITLSEFIDAPGVRRSNVVKSSLHEFLNSSDWGIRVVTYDVLKTFGHLPDGARLSFMDNFKLLFKTKPSLY